MHGIAKANRLGALDTNSQILENVTLFLHVQVPQTSVS